MSSRNFYYHWLPAIAAIALMGAAAAGPTKAGPRPIDTVRVGPGIAHQMPDRSSPEASDAGQARDKAPGIPIGIDELNRIKEGGSPVGSALSPAAPVREAGEDKSGGPTPQVVLTNCNAQAANGFAPSDSHGAVGPTNFVSVSNVTVQVRAKSGCALVSSQTLAAFFAAAGVPAGTTLFDPRVLYHRALGRFFLTAESSNGANDDQFQYFAISQNSLGTSWFLYRLTLSLGATRFCKKATSSFWDYPNAGYSRGRWYVTANDFGTTTTGALLDIALTPTLTGAATTVACFANLPFNLAPPIVIDTATLTTFLSPGSGSGSTIQRRNLQESAAGPGSDTLTTIANVNITAWTAPPNAAQPNGTTLDTLDGRFQSASIQSRGLLWNVHAVSVSTSGGSRSRARFYKLSQSAASTTPSLTVSLHTASCTQLDHIFNPSFATASGAFNAPAFLTVSRTIPTGCTTASSGNAAMLMFQGLNSSGATSTDWLFNTLATSSTQFSGCSPCRWGDYSATQVDVNTLGRAWGWNQFVTGATQFNWQMRVGQVELNLPTRPINTVAYDE